MRDGTVKSGLAGSVLAILLVNILMSLIYLWGARHAWVIPEEAANGIHVITGEPFVWASFVLPIWIAITVINLAWGTAIILRKGRLDRRVWLSILFVWGAAVVIDFAHH